MKKIKNLKKINIVLGSLLFVSVVLIYLYRLLNPTPILEEQACMDRMNKIALKEALYKKKNGKYTKNLKELDSRNINHYYMKCPMSNEYYDVDIKNGKLIIYCKYHNKKMVNNIFVK